MMPREGNGTKVLWVNASENGESVSRMENGGWLTENAGSEDLLRETRKEKIILSVGTASLLITLAVVWIYYR